MKQLKLNYRVQCKAIHRVFGEIEKTQYFCDLKDAQFFADELSRVRDTIGVVYVHEWEKDHWEQKIKITF